MATDIVFGRDILRPSLRREATYDTTRPTSRRFAFDCVACSGQVTLDLERFIGREVGDEGILGPERAAAIRDRFELNVVGKSHDGGWPRLRVEACGHCRQRYLVYVGVSEPANGWMLVTVQGIVELTPDAPAI